MELFDIIFGIIIVLLIISRPIYKFMLYTIVIISVIIISKKIWQLTFGSGNTDLAAIIEAIKTCRDGDTK